MTTAMGLHPLLNPLLAPAPGIITSVGLTRWLLLFASLGPSSFFSPAMGSERRGAERFLVPGTGRLAPGQKSIPAL
ncbi:hypothetical protein AV530_013554 [Patagioenas fasciata monilis]|uniref:Uncharacterized protein n=1 Tax=Patagioenas fasciata monilis TaxID=372326 RepID=A0A1V4JPT4_PATFA|nr:hypothetical protein AV530_013554 [Patagioenas fasciata monilis]